MSEVPTGAYNRNIQLTTIPINKNPIDYVADEALIQAVEIAIALNKPLVVSGEPGTGKTQLAHWVAAQLHQQTQNDAFPFAKAPLVFNTKSGSSATDLFYFYDAVSHFRSKESLPTENFIELRAMGEAIALTHEQENREKAGLSVLKQLQGKKAAQSSVVLIDEIDKAPRDFPNDLLNEMENYSFQIKELNLQINKAASDARIIVIMTSNSEKNLPNAFLRRCVYYHIPFPSNQKLLEITRARMQVGDASYDDSILKAIEKFSEFRRQAINKKPATSEFLDWMNVLRKFNLLNGKQLGQYQSPAETQQYQSSLNVLLKSREDMERLLPEDEKNK